MVKLSGIDVSEWQGDINWVSVKNDDIKFAIIRTGYGKHSNQIDKCFENNIKKAKMAGIKVGVYHYSYALSIEDAKKEAECCLSFIKSAGVKLDLPVYFDVEDPSITKKCNKEQITNMCIAFCTEIEKAGYWAGIYANLNWFNNYLIKEKLINKYTIWLAQYNSTNDMPCDIWQYTSCGKVSGINSNVDMNIMYRDLITEIESTITEEPKPIDPIPPMEEEFDEYVVKKGDILSNIAIMYDTTYSHLAKINSLLNPNIIYPGQILKVPKRDEILIDFYKVKNGDTLSSIALKYDTTVNKIVQDNAIKDPNIIFSGEILKIKK